MQQFLSTYKYKYKKSISYIYIYIYIYYLIKYCRAGRYPSDQNSKNRYLSVIRIFKISVSVSVRIYANGRAGGWAGRPDWLDGSGFTVFCPPLMVRVTFGNPNDNRSNLNQHPYRDSVDIHCFLPIGVRLNLGRTATSSTQDFTYKPKVQYTCLNSYLSDWSVTSSSLWWGDT